MTRVVINVLLVLGIVMFVVLRWLGGGERTTRNIEFFPDMARTARSNAFSANAVLPYGMTMQPPVAGTVRIDAADWVVASVEKDYDPKFGNEMENPFTSSDVAAMARGEVMFDTYCSPCHGATGLGDGAVTKRGYPEPLSLIDGEAAYMSDLDLYRVIQFGGSDMPSYAVQMPPSDRWKAILFLRQLQADVGGQ